MAKAPVPPPLDCATILRLRAELETQYALEDAQIRASRLVREQRDPVNTGSKRYTDIVVRDPRMTDEIARNSATLSLNPAKVTCIYAPGGVEAAEHNTTTRETFYEELLEDAATKIEGQNARTRGIDMCLGDGGTWTKVVFAKELWEESGAIRRRKPGEDAATYDQSTEQAKKDAGQPFVIMAVDPLGFYPIRSGTKLVGGLEVQKRPLVQTLMQYNLSIDGKTGKITRNDIGEPQNKWDGMKTPTNVDYTEFWDEYRCYQILSGAGVNDYLIPPWLHGYGRPPYFPGMGFMMGHWANRKVGWGIAETKRWLIQYSSFLRTTMADVAARDAYRPVVHEVGETTAGALMGKDGKPEFTEDFKAELREILRAYPGDKWYLFPSQDIAPALQETIKQTDEMIESSLTPKVNANIGGGMEGAGFAINTVLAEAKITHHPYVQNLEQMNADIIKFIDWVIVNKIKGTVWLNAAPVDESQGKPRKGGWIGIGPDEITKYPIKVKVEIDPERPTAKLIEGQYHATQVQAGFEGPDQAILAQGRNPDEVREDIEKARLRKSDWYMAMNDQNVAQEMGYGHLLAMSKLAAAVAQTGGLPGLQPNTEAPPSQGLPGAAGAPVTPNQAALTMAPNQAPPDTAQVATGNLGSMRQETPTAGAEVGMTPGPNGQ